MRKTKAETSVPAGPFKTANPLVEEYLAEHGSTRWGTTGRALKSHMKSGIRAHADCFSRDPGTLENRAFFRSCLEGSGVPFEVAHDIAFTSEVGGEPRVAFRPSVHRG